MAELGDFLVSGDATTKVDVEMLDYGYIEKCDDEKTLRGIIETLKSGREGLYPELCQAAEEKLFSVLPEKERRRILRLKHKTTPDQVNDAESDLNKWQSEVHLMDKDLLSTDSVVQTKKKIPPVRGQKVEKLDIPNRKEDIKSQDVSSSASQATSQRLSGYDFHAWEKFNVDDALAMIDDDEIVQEKEATESRLKKKKAAEDAARSRMQRHTKALEVLRAEMNISGLSNVQRKTRAAREKQKGNESFRSGENDEAYSYYSRSLALDDSVAAVYSNRALVCLRTGKLETAEDDCSRALYLEPGFTKARSRRGISRLKLGKYASAIQDFEFSLETDSANKELLLLLQKAKDKYLEVEGKEYVSEKERERRRAALELAVSNGLPIKVSVESSCDNLLSPVTSTNLELVGSGTCEITKRSSENLTRILIEEDSEESDEEECTPKEEFTRIQIEDSSDSEDDEADTEDFVQYSKAETLQSNGSVRIEISNDSDSSSDEPAFTDMCDNNRDKTAEHLKLQANEAMQKGLLPEAIKLYDDCIALDYTSKVAVAAHGNRSLAYLKLKKYDKVLEDTNIVLSHEPENPKALYRRALAYEALEDIDNATKDIDSILLLQPRNELALEAKDKFLRKLKSESESKQNEPIISNSDNTNNDISRSIDLKNCGNEAMKSGNFVKAVEFYSNAIGLDSSNILFFNNRAQAYIKCSLFNKAEADATHVIENSSIDCPNYKAFYRRALARKGLATMESLKGGLNDVLFILSNEPDNKAALTEKMKIEALLKAKEISTEEERRRTLPEFVVNTSTTEKSNISGLTERSSKVKNHKHHEESPEVNTQTEFELNPKEKVEKVPSSSRVPLKTTAAKEISVKNPLVPSDPPKTVYEFERIWRGLKNRPDLFAVYLETFKKSTYKKVLKETCSPDLLSSMLISVRDHLLIDDGKTDKGVSVLEGLASIPKYDMVRCVLPGADLECMNACVDYVAIHVNSEKAKALREKLKI